MGLEIADFLGGKSLGYLYAVAHGAEVIWDFDDENMLKFWLEGASPDPMMDLDHVVRTVGAAGGSLNVTIPISGDLASFNPYPHLGCPVSPCWPRGFPIDDILNGEVVNNSNNDSDQQVIIPTEKIGVLQSLADHEPDVDAMFRMTKSNTPITFKRPEKNVGSVLVPPPSSFSPLNAQASLHFRSAFFSLYLPVSVLGKVSDIWRGYIAQTLFRLVDLRVGFLPRPLVTREKKKKENSVSEFESELELYTRSGEMLQLLDGWASQAREKFGSFEELVEDLFVSLYEGSFIRVEDVKGVQVWLRALNSAGYKLPAMESSKPRSLLPPMRVNFDIGVAAQSLIHKYSREELPENCADMGRSRTFMTAELHTGTRLDTATQLATLGQNVLIAGLKKDEIFHPEALKIANGTRISIYNHNSPVLMKYDSFATTLTADDVVANFEFYKDVPTLRDDVDAFSCSFPASICEVWKMFHNKSVVFLPAHRYNLGRCSKPEFAGLDEWLVELSREERNLIAAMSRYDLEYMRYYLGGRIPDIRLVSSLSGAYTSGVRYGSPKKKTFLIVHSVRIWPQFFSDLVDRLKEARLAVPFREAYPHYEQIDLVSHPAIILLPYSVMSVKLTEFYAMAVPLFVPSPRFYRLHGGFGDDRTASSPPYCSVESRLDETMVRDVGVSHPYSPNREFHEDEEAEMYWLQFSDFYDWPHIETFDSFEDLVGKLGSANLTAMHLGMVEDYARRQFRTYSEWCRFIPKIG